MNPFKISIPESKVSLNLSSSIFITFLMYSFLASNSGYATPQSLITISHKLHKNASLMPNVFPCLAALLRSLLKT